jgi:hypothetical protein
MQVEIDEHVKSVLEFMQGNVPTEKLVGVASALAEIGKPLWGRFPQEAFVPFNFCESKSGPSQPTASESAPVLACAGGDSEAAGACP